MTANKIPAQARIAARTPPTIIPLLVPATAELVELGRAEDDPVTAG
jgi:hypothetical protein